MHEPATPIHSHQLDELVEYVRRVGDLVGQRDWTWDVRADELLNCLGGDLAVVGAVPSGIHRLLQRISRPIAWDDKLFDLLNGR